MAYKYAGRVSLNPNDDKAASMLLTGPLAKRTAKRRKRKLNRTARDFATLMGTSPADIRDIIKEGE